jgi:dipeptidyl aminopeptidase/acylaminoacyl peptidase
MPTRAALALVLMLSAAFGQQPAYQKPPQPVLDVLNAPPSPNVSFSPARDRMLLTHSTRYPTIAQLSEPMLRIAGLRINPNTNGPHTPALITGLTLKNFVTDKETKVTVPLNARLSSISWSPDGKHFSFFNTTATGIELWVGNATTGAARRIPGVALNAAYGQAAEWMPDNKTLLCKTVVAGRGRPPAAPKVPAGPNIQESYGRPSPAATFQDLLKNPHDEELFEYYATSQLVLVNTATSLSTLLGKPGIYASADPSPDGNHFLVVRNHKPYSYLRPAGSFPKEVEVWDRTGRMEHRVASLPLADQVPIEGVPTGPRSYQWRPTEPATLIWVEALDGGNPRTRIAYRDRVLTLKAPFQGEPVELAKTEHRFGGIAWGEKGLALLRDSDNSRRWARTFIINADQPSQAPRLVWDRSVQDRYNDPGTPVMRRLANGQSVMWQSGNHIFLSGNGASPQGDRPFLDRFDLTTLKAERLFRCDDQSYESVVTLLSDDGSRFVTRYETPTEPPNYYLRATGGSSKRALTNFNDPSPQLRGITKQLVTYKRDDGTPLSFTLYLPPDYKPGTRLPTVVWAYPREFSDADTAGQVSGSTKRFTSIGSTSHLFFALLGYAILDDATMPVIGDTQTMNNTYVEQIVSSAKAAIDKAVEMGVTDRNRVGVGGHSYGAFMTANLLAHSDLFRAGIARSGAYNRTLTPFGFQSERRTIWQAAETYLKMSPFMYADKVKEPILLIHGEADNNSGTFPVQSERMYQAVKGNGGNIRYVTLPHESHGYAARESIEHTLYEMINWFEKHVKNAPSQPAAASNIRD